MKVAVINFSGNVGKSTIARHLLLPRLNKAQLISVESINSDGDSESETIRGKQFGELMQTLNIIDNDVVVDIGASNVEDFIKQMKQYHGSYEDFDFFIVPTASKIKQQRDTISTIDALANVGVAAEKIRLVFNMVESGDIPSQLFSGLFEYHANEKTFTIKTKVVIHSNDIYGQLKNNEQSIIDISNDTTNLKEQLKAAISTEEKIRISRLIGIRRLAIGVVKELDNVFETLLE